MEIRTPSGHHEAVFYLLSTFPLKNKVNAVVAVVVIVVMLLLLLSGCCCCCTY